MVLECCMPAAPSSSSSTRSRRTSNDAGRGEIRGLPTTLAHPRRPPGTTSWYEQTILDEGTTSGLLGFGIKSQDSKLKNQCRDYAVSWEGGDHIVCGATRTPCQSMYARVVVMSQYVWLKRRFRVSVLCKRLFGILINQTHHPPRIFPLLPFCKNGESLPRPRE